LSIFNQASQSSCSHLACYFSCILSMLSLSYGFYRSRNSFSAKFRWNSSRQIRYSGK